MMRVHKLTIIEALHRLGLPGALGAILLVVAAVYGVFGLLPANEARSAAEARAARAEERLARLQRGDEPMPQTPASQLASFHQALPAQEEATAAMDRIYAAAATEGLTLARGEYQLLVEPETRLARYQILLPVRGSYLQLRRFLGAALAAVPALALDDVEFQRKEISQTTLEGRVRMTLHLSRR